MRKVIYILPLALFLIVAGYFGYQLLFGNDPRAIPSALIDKPAPEFDLPALHPDGKGLARADLVGDVSIVNIFASWCVPCRAEHPMLVRLSEETDVALHGIAYKDKRAAARAFLNELGDPYDRIGFDLDGRAAIEWGVYGVPETYVIDEDGRIRYKRTGPITAKILKDDILPLLEDLSK